MWRDHQEAIAALNACPTNIFPSVHNFLRILAVLVMIQAHRDRLPSTAEIIDKFASSGPRRFDFRI